MLDLCLGVTETIGKRNLRSFLSNVDVADDDTDNDVDDDDDDDQRM